MEAISSEFSCLTMLYAADFVVIVETEDDLIKRLNKWKDNRENRGMRVNMNKTNVIINGECQKLMQKSERWPYGVCGRGVGNNSIQCTNCQKWIHRKCCGVNDSISNVMKTFVCRHCLNPVTSAARASVDIGAVQI